MMTHKLDVLIYAEDPGTANYIAELPSTLAAQGWSAKLLAGGSAYEYLGQRGISVETGSLLASAESILATMSPRVLLVGTSENPDTLGLALVAKARSAGIVSVGVVDALANADYRFRGQSHNPLAYVPEWLLVPDELTKTAYINLNYPAKQIIVCGHPHYDYVYGTATRLAEEDHTFLRKRVLPSAPIEQKVIVFVAEVSTGLNIQQYQRSSEYTLLGSGTKRGRTEIVLEEFLEAIQLIKPRPYLVLRLHPKNTIDEFSPYLDEFDLISSGGSPLELIYVADYIIGMTSMLLLEAVLMGKSTLAVIPRQIEQEWLPTIHIGITPHVTTKEQLRSTLLDLISGNLQSQTILAKNHFVFGSLQRVVKFITELLISEEVTV